MLARWMLRAAVSGGPVRGACTQGVARETAGAAGGPPAASMPLDAPERLLDLALGLLRSVWNPDRSLDIRGRDRSDSMALEDVGGPVRAWLRPESAGGLG